MNTASRYRSLIDRYWLISFVRQSETNSRTFKELEDWAPPLSRRALCRHLAFIAEKRYLLKTKKKGKFSVYRFNKRLEGKFKRIDSLFDTWLGFSTLHKTKTDNLLNTSRLDETKPRKFRPILRSLVGNKAAIQEFDSEFRMIGVEL